MGVVPTIDFDKFPAQSDRLRKQVRILYHHRDAPADRRPVTGTVVRDDIEAPYLTIFRTHDNVTRYLLASECQYDFI